MLYVTKSNLLSIAGCSIACFPLSAAADNLSAFEDNYFLPYYHESRVNQSRFMPLNPNGEPAKDTFIQFQFSAKYRLLAFDSDGLYIAYTSGQTGRRTLARPTSATATITLRFSTGSVVMSGRLIWGQSMSRTVLAVKTR